MAIKDRRGMNGMSGAFARRDVIRSAGAAAGVQLLAGPLVLTAGSPNEKIGVAVIGCGGMGAGRPGVAAAERLVALCDVDEKTMAKAVASVSAKVPNPKVYYDYRKMYDECQKDMDAVLISTPDHQHAPAAIRAIRLGKHAFVEKPLAHNIYECRTLAAEARARKVHTQMGNEGHCGEGWRRFCEYIWAGAIGNVLESHSLLGRNFGGRGGRPAGQPVPPGLHWDEWLGPAPHRDYHGGLHPFGWRSWRQFGTGTIGDIACHVMDGTFWALKIAEAKRFTVECLAQKDGSEEHFTRDNVIRWDVPARADMPPLKVFAYDNDKIKPEVMKEAEQKYGVTFPGVSSLYIGEKGIMMTVDTATKYTLLPESKHKEFPPPPKTIPRAKGEIADLFYAIRTGTPPCSNFIDASGPFAEFVLAGHLAMFAGVGQKVEWDVAEMKCTNRPDVNAHVKREYRKGWEV
jgi:predicted dehydrogenase